MGRLPNAVVMGVLAVCLGLPAQAAAAPGQSGAPNLNGLAVQAAWPVPTPPANPELTCRDDEGSAVEPGSPQWLAAVVEAQSRQGTFIMTGSTGFRWSSSGQAISGTVSKQSVGRGSIGLRCDASYDFDMSFRQVYKPGFYMLPSLENIDVDASGSTSCTFDIAMAGAAGEGTLTGTLEGVGGYTSDSESAECPAAVADAFNERELAVRCVINQLRLSTFITGGTGVFAANAGTANFQRSVPTPIVTGPLSGVETMICLPTLAGDGPALAVPCPTDGDYTGLMCFINTAQVDCSTREPIGGGGGGSGGGGDEPEVDKCFSDTSALVDCIVPLPTGHTMCGTGTWGGSFSRVSCTLLGTSDAIVCVRDGAVVSCPVLGASPRMLLPAVGVVVAPSQGRFTGFTLKKGSLDVRIVSPRQTVKATTAPRGLAGSTRITLAAAPGASCTLTASRIVKGARQTSTLATGVVAAKRGVVATTVTSATVRERLKAPQGATVTLSATCTVGTGAKRVQDSTSVQAVLR